MRWTVVVIAAIVTLAIETSVRSVLSLHSLGGISPSFLALLVMFITLFAPRLSALWICVVLGLLIDLLTPLARPDAPPAFVAGPHALGFAFAGYLVLHLRPLVMRDRVPTLMFLAFIFVLASNLVVVAMYTLRSMYPEGDVVYFATGSPLMELMRYAGIALYTAVIAIPVGWLLLQSMPLWGFVTVTPRRRISRSPI